MKRACLVLPFLVGCGEQPNGDDLVSESELAATVCGKGPTVKGIDVSYYQGTINWTSVKADNVRYAFIRVSDGTTFSDPKFGANWAGAKAQGILRGAYQFFRPNQDPIAQADMLIDAIGGAVEPGDLPPVIDVEADGGLTPAQVESKVRQWVNHVKAAIGREPIIYTGFYFWRDQVGAPDLTQSPLWHAQYTTATCPNIAPPWDDWAFWQYSSAGTVAGIGGNVDMNRFNGTYEELVALTNVTPPVSCGEIDAAGGIVDDGDPCFRAGGPPASLRTVSTVGEGGDLIWTHTTEDATEANFAQWNLRLAEAGRYKVEVSTPAAFAQSTQALYVIQAGTETHEVAIDQTAGDGWQSLGEYEFAGGPDQFVHLGDNTGEPLAGNTQLVFDSVRLTRMSAPSDPTDPTDPTTDPKGEGGGCNVGGTAGFAVLAAVAAIRRRRR